MQITISERAQLETELIQNWYDEIIILSIYHAKREKEDWNTT